MKPSSPYLTNLRQAIFFILIFLLTSFIGCSLPSNTAKNSPKSSVQPNLNTKQNRIALVMKTITNPFFSDMEIGARKAEKELGIKLLVKAGTQEASVDKQIGTVESLIEDRVDAIVIAPSNSKDLIPVLKKAENNGIKIIIVDDKLDSDFMEKSQLTPPPFVGIDNEAASYEAVKYMTTNRNTPTQIALIEGTSNSISSQSRKKGILKAISENNNLKLVYTENANWKIDEAYNLASDIISKNPNISMFICENDMMALGVNEYVNKTLNKKILISGFDAIDEIKPEIRDNNILVTVDQEASLQGYTGVKLANDLINNKTIPTETILPVKLINKNTIDK